MKAPLQTKPKTSTSTSPTFTPVRSGLLQRKCACGGNPGPSGECEACRKKRLSSRQTDEAGAVATRSRGAGLWTIVDSSSPLEREADEVAHMAITDHQSDVSPRAPVTLRPQRKTPNGEFMPSDEAATAVELALHDNGQPLDPTARAFMEPRFGHDFSHVRVHTDAKAAESARAVNARAYTINRDIVFGPGQFSLQTTAGLQLLAHELAHTLQQNSLTRGAGLGLMQRREISEGEGEEEQSPEACLDPNELAEEEEEEEKEEDEEEQEEEEGLESEDDSELGALTAGHLIGTNEERPGGGAERRKRRREKRRLNRQRRKNRRKGRRQKKKKCIGPGQSSARPPSGKRSHKKKKKTKKVADKKKKKKKCCIEYDLSQVQKEELPAGNQPDIADKETNRDLPAIPRDCAYIIRWDMHQIADRIIISDNKTGAVYRDQTLPGEDRHRVTGPASVHIRVVPNPIQKPTRYNYSISKICGRVKVTKTCYLMGFIPLRPRVSYETFDPDKDYSKTCDGGD